MTLPKFLPFRRVDDYVNLVILIVIFSFFGGVYFGSIPANVNIVTKIEPYLYEQTQEANTTCHLSNLDRLAVTFFQIQVTARAIYPNSSVVFQATLFWSHVTGYQPTCLNVGDSTGLLYDCFTLLQHPALYAANQTQFADPGTAEITFIYGNGTIKPDNSFGNNTVSIVFDVNNVSNPALGAQNLVTSSATAVTFAQSSSLVANSLADVLEFYAGLAAVNIDAENNIEAVYSSLDGLESDWLNGLPCSTAATPCSTTYNGDITKLLKAANAGLQMTCQSFEIEPSLDYALRLIAYGSLAAFVGLFLGLVYHALERYGLFLRCEKAWRWDHEEEAGGQSVGEKEDEMQDRRKSK